ncbi:hypothetical protein [Algoriphagus taiwanensis]|uniref:Uncharacterized protein n=1 Tax=Algoriphagus taiwanensis TaxID=1445656 RepID=A0ABQ6Q6S1_9BACT|nr:hypothetical protein Ataiwa_36430 [Algoriphagus taiwanensis]
MKKIGLLALSLYIGYSSFAQSPYDQVDFLKEGKANVKMGGKVAKSFVENPTFINDYYFNQATFMKGESQAKPVSNAASVFSDVTLLGISPEGMQKLVEELYIHMVGELDKIGFKLVDGDALLQTKAAQDQIAKGKNNFMIGQTGDEPIFDKQSAFDIGVYGVKERLYFRPAGKNVYVFTGNIPGTFYGKVAAAEKTNMISVGYNITFANFKGSSTISSNKLKTQAGLEVTPVIQLVNPDGLFTWITFGQSYEGKNDWSEGLIETDKNDGSYWGISSNAAYSLVADEAKYLDELRKIIMAMQVDIAAAIKAEM